MGETRVTARMLTAGRRAFLRKRRKLDSLHQYFECDLADFLSHIYREMHSASGVSNASSFNRFMEDAGRENDLVRQGVE